VQIPYFAENQNLVFVPALLALLAATVLICLPIVFVQGLRRAKRLTPVAVVAGALALVALVGTAWLAGIGFRTLGDERADVRAQIEQSYDLRLTAGEVGELVDGGKPERTLPTQAAAAGLPKPQKPQALQLVPSAPGADTYDLTIGGKRWPS
jgi:hypothetical protein